MPRGGPNPAHLADPRQDRAPSRPGETDGLTHCGRFLNQGMRGRKHGGSRLRLAANRAELAGDVNPCGTCLHHSA